MKALKLLSIALLFLPIISMAQMNISSDTIEWKGTSVIDKLTGEEFQLKTKFITYGTNKVEWVQGESVSRKSFQINQVVGNWQNLDLDGEVEYKVEMKDQPGTIVFKRVNGVMSVAFQISNGGTEVMPFQFLIQSVNLK